jgi:hypothetical protein
MDFIVLMVAIHKVTNEEFYVAVHFDTGSERLPENNPNDIMRCVNICNANNDDEYRYIDMYGIVHHGGEEIWESIDE